MVNPGPINISAVSRESLARAITVFNADLHDYNPPRDLIQKIDFAIGHAVARAEFHFSPRTFGGWMPGNGQFGITTLRPHHMNHLDGGSATVNQWTWTSSGSDTSASFSDDFVTEFELDDNEVMMLYGYFNKENSPNISEMQLVASGHNQPIWNLETMDLKPNPYILFPEPFVLEPRATFQVKVSCKATATATVEQAGFLGFFIAPTTTLKAQ